MCVVAKYICIRYLSFPPHRRSDKFYLFFSKSFELRIQHIHPNNNYSKVKF